ncbi:MULTISPECIES: hypothetical protein [unclassified Rhodococcus (in: high G+C Gram-positive bacteria)]|uniref:hypothetical protein n=1 Tax=unclassified Rhodococcus (in: high G+C Gram-positive bacteria) TaxID=192944 RepID=UPI0006F87A43|nr:MULTISPECIES: hypothetical protein [unclassified Rhodococcus (in: high G+C Gram-positive bacteria)]KQU28429.1 hypothetical protein ASG69_10470 [Rhodococcus sp. Leaf225]
MIAEVSIVVVLAQPPTNVVTFSAEVWDPLMSALSWLMGFAVVVCIAALFVCGAVFVNQRKSTGTQVVEDGTLARILLCAAVIGSAAGIARVVLA